MEFGLLILAFIVISVVKRGFGRGRRGGGGGGGGGDAGSDLEQILFRQLGIDPRRTTSRGASRSSRGSRRFRFDAPDASGSLLGAPIGGRPEPGSPEAASPEAALRRARTAALRRARGERDSRGREVSLRSRGATAARLRDARDLRVRQTDALQARDAASVRASHVDPISAQGPSAREPSALRSHPRADSREAAPVRSAGPAGATRHDDTPLRALNRLPALQRAIALSEILGAPVSLRTPGDDSPGRR